MEINEYEQKMWDFLGWETIAPRDFTKLAEEAEAEWGGIIEKAHEEARANNTVVDIDALRKANEGLYDTLNTLRENADAVCDLWSHTILIPEWNTEAYYEQLCRGNNANINWEETPFCCIDWTEATRIALEEYETVTLHDPDGDPVIYYYV